MEAEARKRWLKVTTWLVSAELQKLRKQAGLTQADIARGTGIHRAVVSRIENCHHLASLETIYRFCSVVGYHPSEVLWIVDAIQNLPDLIAYEEPFQ